MCKIYGNWPAIWGSLYAVNITVYLSSQLLTTADDRSQWFQSSTTAQNGGGGLLKWPKGFSKSSLLLYSQEFPLLPALFQKFLSDLHDCRQMSSLIHHRQREERREIQALLPVNLTFSILHTQTSIKKVKKIQRSGDFNARNYIIK